MNYRESLLTWKDERGKEHTFSAYKVKYMGGDESRTEVLVEPVDGQIVRFYVPRPSNELREQLSRALAAGE